MWVERSWPDVGKEALGEACGLSGEGRGSLGLGRLQKELGSLGRWTGPAEGSPCKAGAGRAKLDGTGPLAGLYLPFRPNFCVVLLCKFGQELFSFLAWVPVESDESERFHKLEGSIMFKIHKFTKVFISHHSSSLSGSPSGIGIVPSINPNFFFKRKAKRMGFAYSV
ncbi:hypothetical protein M9H77_35277 [Catharanthus roseus]|uniref:Uncharacterized protein n=1 Tax=Catharanthus roseus TaxID=4058 RepID=A0ACB9ZQQ0_CATRO|nr:hypothetical protein M9H77_35277 [Catharanthus roseus]